MPAESVYQLNLGVLYVTQIPLQNQTRGGFITLILLLEDSMDGANFAMQ